jgi:hypothetical protein
MLQASSIQQHTQCYNQLSEQYAMLSSAADMPAVTITPSQFAGIVSSSNAYARGKADRGLSDTTKLDNEPKHS